MNLKRFTLNLIRFTAYAGSRLNRADQIASNSGLELADVYAALTYYYDHRKEIDESILSDESDAVEMRNRTKSKLSGTAT